MFSQFKDRVARRNKGTGQTASQHNRLSKPRTNTNSKSASPVVTSDLPFPDTSRYTDLNAKSRQHIKEVISPTVQEVESPVWSDQNMFDSEAAGEGRGRRSTAVSRSNSRAHSRSGSALRSFVRSRRNSIANLKNLSGSKVSLVSNTQTDVEAAIRLLQEVKRNASPEELAALREALERPTESATTFDQSYDRSSPEISLTRRKSLVQTPGVATRKPQSEGKRRTWSSWKAPPMRPGDEAKWKAPQEGPSPLDRLRALDLADSTQVQTPGENYSPFLGYKPGTLMVVNGNPSPEMSTDDLDRFAEANLKNDYFSATELVPSPLALKKEQGQSRSRSSGASDSKAIGTPDPAGEEKIMITYVKPVAKPKKRPQSIAVCTRPPTQGADTLAKDYQSYIPYSPFENHMAIQSTWQVPEPTTDELFMEDLQHPRRTSDLVELSATITDVSELSPPSTATSIHTLETPKNQRARPSPRTSDSGYSSIGSSNGSFKVASNDEQQQHPCALRVAVPPSETARAKFRASRRQTMSFELPAHNDLPARFEQSLLATVPKQPHGRTLSLEIPRDTAELPSMDDVLSPSTPLSTTSTASVKPLPRQPRRLQKRRPSQPQVPVVQSAVLSREVIPEVPDDVRGAFTRRLSITPGMECLTKTYPSKDHTTADESVTSFDPVEPALSPIQLEPDHTPTRPTRSRRRSLSFFRRKSTSGQQDVDGDGDMPSPKVLDLGTIAVSLGASPYDPSMFGSFQPREVVERPTHPHQLGQARSHSRSRSAMSMNSDTAAEYARMFSKDRVLPDPEMVEMPQHGKQRRRPKMEIGEAKQLRRRTQTLYMDEAPPMPSIDHAKYAAPLSARPRLERVEAPTANQSRIRADSRPQSPLKPNHTRPPSAHKNVDREHSINWEQHSLQWRQRRQSIGDSLRPRPKLEVKENVAATPRARPMSYTAQDLTTFGRYGGGLDYEHEGRGQIGGSAGTRQLHSYATPKSMYFKQSYGVDLSDVPIFVHRQQ